MDIRLLTPNDAEIFKQLRMERCLDSPTAFGSSYEEEGAVPLEEIRERLTRTESEGNFVFGAFVGDELAGMVGLRRNQRLKYHHKADLWGMFVRREWRGHGAGKYLLDAAIEHAKTLRGLRQISLGVNTLNQTARGLYQSRGFVTYGIESGALYYEGAYYDVEYMQLFLNRNEAPKVPENLPQ